MESVTVGGRTTDFEYLTIEDPGWDGAWTALAPGAVAADRAILPGTGSVPERTTTKLLDASGRTVAVIDPLAGTGVTGHHPVVTVYNDVGEPISSSDESGAETTVEIRYSTDRLVPREPDEPCGCGPDPAWAESADIGSVSTTTDPDGIVSDLRFSGNGDLVEERTGDGAATPRVTRHTYGELGRRIRTEIDAGTDAVPMTVITTYGYDANGRPTRITDGPSPGVAELTTTLVYDRLGRVVEELGPVGDPERHHITYTYDGLGRMLTETRAASDPDAKVMTTWRYDAAGRVDETVTFLDGYDDAEDPHPSLASHPEALVTRYAYDADGRLLVEVTGPANAETHAWPESESPDELIEISSSDLRRVTHYSYEAETGALAEVARPDGSVEATVYDAAGRVREVTETAAPTGVGTPPTRLVARYDYDLRGRVLHEWSPWVDTAGDPGEVVVDRTWTPTGLLATETDPHLDGAPSGDVATVSMGYTDGGRLAEVRDALGHRVSYSYELGRRALRQVWDASDTSVVSQQTWTYTRDGRLVTSSSPHAPTESSPALTTYAYDSRGRQVTRTDASGRVESATYNNSGQPATLTWTDGPSDHLDFDQNGVLLGMEVLAASKLLPKHLLERPRRTGSCVCGGSASCGSR